MPARKQRKTKQASGDVLGSHEAAWLLGAHVETLRRLARKGEIPVYKVGKDWRFSKKALRTWMATHHIRQQSRLVLVVDDEKSIRETVAKILKAGNCRVATAANGEQALEAAQREMPDVVLLDLVMPGMSSADVLKALHAMDPDVPVIIITGYPDSTLLTEALRYPPVTLLPKPVDRVVLFGAIRRVLEGAKRKTGHGQRNPRRQFLREGDS